MLVATWEGMYEQIERIDAMKRLMTYDAVVMANPYVRDEDRQRVIASWEQTAMPRQSWIVNQIARMAQMIGTAFGGGVRYEAGERERT